MGCLLCCFKPKRPKKPEPELPVENKAVRTTVLIVGNVAVGKTTLINCLHQKKKQSEAPKMRTNLISQMETTMQH